MTDRFVVGILGAPFGLKGFVKVRSLSGETAHLERLRAVVLRRGNVETPYEVEETAPAAASLVMKFKGIDTPEAAKALGGAELISGRAQAAPLQGDEFYVEDLRGITVVAGPIGPDGSGEPLGEILDVIEGGGGDLIELGLPSGERRLIPFRKEFFGDILPESRRAVLLAPWILE
ncbi:MAG: ribosome maturation factor RimM [Treponema sp.]|nr:ribosome maturation factor RimM [Treponema sp.]